MQNSVPPYFRTPHSTFVISSAFRVPHSAFLRGRLCDRHRLVPSGDVTGAPRAGIRADRELHAVIALAWHGRHDGDPGDVGARRPDAAVLRGASARVGVAFLKDVD